MKDNKTKLIKKRLFFFVNIGLVCLIFLMLFIAVFDVITANGENIYDYLVLSFNLMLVISMLIKIFGIQDFYKKITFYIIDVILLFLITIFSKTLISSWILYGIILTDFYISAPGFKNCAYMFGANAVLLSIGYLLGTILVTKTETPSLSIAMQYFIGIGALSIHFTMFNFAMVIWRQNKQIEKSRIELLQAYHKLEESTVYQERNRIAKEIHDTAGHSLTTMIMQAESAKLILEQDSPAYNAVTTIGLQAKNCLAQLRMSIHLLSGRSEEVTFQRYLEKILFETTNATNLTIRHKIDDIYVINAAEHIIANSLREGITNGVRHGKSTAFVFELKDTPDGITFYLSDNGVGGKNGDFVEGFGLRTTRAKVEGIGGSATFTAHPDEGFDILLNFPNAIKRDPEETK